MGIIYLIRNHINGKLYVGQTRRTMQDRWNDHCKGARSTRCLLVIHKAIRKYGESNFSLSTISHAETQEQLDSLERYWIETLNASNPLIGYNRIIGCCAPRHTPESKAKISATRLRIGYHHSPESRAKMSAAGKGRPHPWLKGKKLSEEHNNKLKAAKRTPEFRAKISLARKGKKGHPHSPEVKAKLIAVLKAYWEKRRGQNGAV